MRRLFVILVLGAVAVAAATIADYPGSVDITWQGLEIGTSVGVLAAVLALAALVLWAAIALAAGAIRLPARFRRNRRERRRRAGEAALTRGMAALAAGDAAAAQRYGSRAELLLGPATLPLLLAAQAAQLAGNEGDARRRYTALLDAREGEFLGLRGLVGQALRTGDREEALRLARRAQALRPSAAWAFETLFALEVAAGDWEAARNTLDGAARYHLVPEARAAHWRAVILYELSRMAEAAGDLRRAISLAANAVALAPDLTPAAVRQARLLMGEDRQRAARRAVEHAWRLAPHPDLARVWAELGDGLPALELVTWFERLAAHNPESVETRVALAEAALAAQLWGEARRNLGLAIDAEGASRRLCLLMARLEESEHPQSGAERDWLDRALVARAGPAYACSNCGSESRDWQTRCDHCGGFDTLHWRAAAPVSAPASVLPAAEAPILAPPLPAIPTRLASAGPAEA